MDIKSNIFPRIRGHSRREANDNERERRSFPNASETNEANSTCRRIVCVRTEAFWELISRKNNEQP